LSLTACSSMPSWMQPTTTQPAPAATTMQFESEPAGAEARTSFGQSCRTPCSVTVAGNEFTVSFSLPGYRPQTVPVRMTAASEDSREPTSEAEPTGARLVPNPVFVELQPITPPPAARKKAPPKRKPAAATTAKPATSPAKPAAKPAARPAPPPPPAAPAPEPAPASPWPPPPQPR
jgi:hypothetical protein